jgi:hypothetical protein
MQIGSLKKIENHWPRERGVFSIPHYPQANVNPRKKYIGRMG